MKKFLKFEIRLGATVALLVAVMVVGRLITFLANMPSDLAILAAALLAVTLLFGIPLFWLIWKPRKGKDASNNAA